MVTTITVIILILVILFMVFHDRLFSNKEKTNRVTIDKLSSEAQQNVSNILKEFINSMIEEITLNGNVFDETKKKYLKKYCDSENVNYEELYRNILCFMDLYMLYKKHTNSENKRLLKIQSEFCFVDEKTFDAISNIYMNE